MSTLAQLQQPSARWDMPMTKPLDEAVWQAWVMKGKARDTQSNAARTRALKLVVVAALLVAAALGSDFVPFQAVVRFVVTAGAVVVMFQAIHERHFVLAAVFGALAFIYNPLVPAFSFSGDWQRAVLAASALPFVASMLGQRKAMP